MTGAQTMQHAVTKTLPLQTTAKLRLATLPSDSDSDSHSDFSSYFYRFILCFWCCISVLSICT